MEVLIVILLIVAIAVGVIWLLKNVR